MLRLDGLIGRETDTALHDRLHELKHAGAIEYVFVGESDLGRRRLRITTDRGTDCAISLRRSEELADGTVLLIEPDRAIIVRLGKTRLWRLRARDREAALQLGWTAGNLHWRIRFEGADLLVMLDAPVDEYRARIQSLILAGRVEAFDGS